MCSFKQTRCKKKFDLKKIFSTTACGTSQSMNNYNWIQYYSTYFLDCFSRKYYSSFPKEKFLY